MKVACLTVVYPGMKEFLVEYLESVKKQTFNEFDLIVVNDGLRVEHEDIVCGADKGVQVFVSCKSPQKNRLFGMKKCYELGYDIVICSDSDETMYPDRIETAVAYFSENPNRNIVYSNSVYSQDAKYFDLYYKDTLELADIVDFNVLGYGALNLRRDLIPFVVDQANEKVMVFDWWLGFMYLLNNEQVNFLKESKNNYRLHGGNVIGPSLEITKEGIEKGLLVKRNIYEELIKYCVNNDAQKRVALFKAKRNEIEEVENYIKVFSIESYIAKVKQYFIKREKMYWWQDVLSCKQIG